MEPHLAEFLGNNDPPSEAVLFGVKDFLSKPLQELDKKGAEIQRLIQALEELTVQRDGIQKAIDEYSPILSPIRRIPSDILHEIFYHCLPTHRNPVMSTEEPPLLLTRICQSWRSIALSSPRIWARLHLSLIPHFADSYSHYPADPYAPWPGMDVNVLREKQRETAEKYANTMQARRTLAGIWLSRSGTCPLSISFTFIGSADRISQDDLTDESALPQLLMSILSFSQRFDDLELSMPFEIYQILQDRISINRIPMLRKLRISFYERITPHPDLPKKPVILLQAPNLQSVSLMTDNVAVLDSRNIPSSWENLTRLSFHSAITAIDAVEVLRRCRNLDYCKLVISNGDDVYIDPGDILSLPHLRFLCIQIGGLDMMSLFYRRIDAPNLDWFDYQKYNRFPGYMSTGNNNDQTTLLPSPVLALLEKSTRMRKLSFDPISLTAQDILFCFRFASQLTHLIVGKPPNHGPPNDYVYWMGPGNFSLDLLIIEEDSESGASSSSFGKEVLLPKLEVLEVYLRPNNFTDENLQRFILSRLGDPVQKGVSSLRYVKVTFERQQEIDISEEINRRAKEAGVEIELDLAYAGELLPSNNAKYIDIFSPWYGLSESDRSWNYPDVEIEGS